MAATDFDQLVKRALKRIPAEFREIMQRENIAVVVLDWPDPQLVEEVLGDKTDLLYGLFTGIPLPERQTQDMELPNIIHLFRGPLEQDFPAPAELEREVAITLFHEIGHFMGMDEETLEKRGYG
jgi:predicted Zn-dependent protease with MMP-like domain